MNVTAEVLEVGANGAVIQLSGRRFPGVLVQGDSLSILVSDLSELRELASPAPDSQVGAVFDRVSRALQVRLDFYEAALTRRGIELPYSKHPSNDPRDPTA